MASLKCDIVTPGAKLFCGEVHMVVVPGVEGEMGFLYHHVPLVSTLADGVVRVQTEQDGETLQYALQGGYVEVTGEKVIVLADRAIPVPEIDVAAAKTQLAELEAWHAALPEGDAEKTVIPADIAWYKVQLAAAGEAA